MFLQSSDFTVRPYRILHIEESPDFIEFVEKQEIKLLISLLGYSLWAEMEEDLESSNPSAAFTALRDGGEYVYSGKTYKYDGIVDLLKPAVMSVWIEQNNFIFTKAGFVENSPQENSTVLDPAPFIVQLWNEYVVKVGECHNQKGGTLYGFMKANEDDYPDWDFTLPTLKNRFGL